MSQDFTASSNLGPIQVESGRIRKEPTSRYSWIRQRTPAVGVGTSQRTVFIAVLAGQWALFNPSHKGKPMFATQPDAGPFPGIQTLRDIRGNRRWVLGVLQDSSTSPSRSDFRNAQYFQCEGELREIRHAELEAWQPVGTTDLSNDTITNYEMKLWQEWDPLNYDWRLWNSQNFSLYLAFLVIRQASREANLLALQLLSMDLLVKQDGRLKNMAIRKHLTSMFGMPALGAATGGIGALAVWSFGMHNMFDMDSAIGNRAAQLQRLVTRFPELRSLVPSHDTDGEQGG